MSLAAEKLLAPSTSKDEILAYLKELKPTLQKDGIIELGLFGSYAKGTADMFSDIDIFIKTSDEFCEKFIGFEAMIYLDELRHKIAQHFKIGVDLCDIASFSQERTAKVLKGGINA